MKCPLCNGKGEYMHQCGGYRPCEHCNGTGKIVQTNDEWRRTCSTEEFADWLRGVYWHCHEIDCEHCNYPWRCMEKGDIVKWLKEKHEE